MTIKAILFDKDGTLIDFDATFAPATAKVLFELAGGDAALASRMAAAVDFDPASCVIAAGSVLVAGSLENISDELFPLSGASDRAAFNSRVDGLYVKHSLETLMPFDDLVPTLDALAAMGLSLGVATNDSESGARSHLGKLNVTERFCYIAGYDSGFGEKPDPGMVTAFAEHLNIAPSELIMVGDSSHDCGAARAAGAVAVGVTNDGANAEALTPHADYLLPGIGALPGFVSRLNGEHITA